MSEKEIKHTGTFTAKSADEDTFTIHKFTEYCKGHTSSGPYCEEGMKKLETEDGLAVNWIEKGKYVIIGVKEIPVTSDDPNAP